MKNFQFIGNADVTPLLAQIMRQPALWKADTYLRDYPQGPFGDTETIFLRFPPASVTELEQSQKDQHECVWMDGEIHLPAARPIILWLMARMEGERLGRCMINKLRPGGMIFPHADTPVHANYWDRHHVVIQSSKGSTFRCGEEQIQMETGQAWWFQNAIEHEVINNGSCDRIHLIVDIRTFRVDAKAPTPTKPMEKRDGTYSAGLGEQSRSVESRSSAAAPGDA